MSTILYSKEVTIEIGEFTKYDKSAISFKLNDNNGKKSIYMFVRDRFIISTNLFILNKKELLEIRSLIDDSLKELDGTVMETTSNNTLNSAPHMISKETYDDYKGEAELKLDNLHIYGIKTIKKYKNNSFLIKSANGTFSIPIDKFELSEKINFTQKLIKSYE